MKTKLITLGLLLFIIGCNSTQQDENATDKMGEHSDTASESSVVYKPSEAIWSYEYNQQTEEFELKKVRPLDSDTLTGQTLEKIINTSWPRVQIVFMRTSKDTAYISIPDSEVLTQQMGTAGAESFMISTTFSFTELKGIQYVAFDFEEGDHAIPGVYKRTSWDKNQ